MTREAETTGRRRVLSLHEAIDELAGCVAITEIAYQDEKEPARRRSAARRLVALEMARQALQDLEAAERITPEQIHAREGR